MKTIGMTGTTETERLFSPKANAAHMAQSIAQHRVGESKRRKLFNLEI